MVPQRELLETIIPRCFRLKRWSHPVLPCLLLHSAEKRDNQKGEEWVEKLSRKNTQITEDVPVRRVCPPVPSCVAVAACVVPVLLRFALSRPSLIHLPSPSWQAPVDGEKVWEKEQQNTSSNQILLFVIPNFGPAARNSDGGETADNKQSETKRRDRKHENPAELTF